MNNFIKYPSIENHYNQKTIDYWRQHIQSDDIFYTQEKIHGANFSVHWKDGKLAYAKRNGFIGEGENFYNYQRMVERYKDRFEAIFKEFHENSGKPSIPQIEMILYGELCGGCFPSVRIKGENIKAIQKGVYYSPDIEFILYDIAIVVGHSFESITDSVISTKEERVITFSNPDQLRTLAMGHNIPFVPIMAQGTFDFCLGLNNTFESNLYPQFVEDGVIKPSDNIAEGFVIKPYRNIMDHLGNRLLIKSKSPKWAEKVDEHETRAKKVESEAVKQIHENLKLYLTENRYSNLISKHGPDIQDFKNFQQLTRELNIDAIEEYEKDDIGKISLDFASPLEYKEAKTLFWKDVTNFVKSKILGLTRQNPAV